MLRKVLLIDLETRSGASIVECGHYKYAQDKDFEILLFGYRTSDMEQAEVIDLKQGEELPSKIVTDLMNPNVIKVAHNAAFEWWCLNQAGYDTPLNHWVCTSAYGRYLGYPGSLAGLGEAIGLPEDKQKMKVGKSLIQYFCVPQKPTKANGGRKYNNPEHDPEKWELFKEYCGQDVDSEWEVMLREKVFDYPKRELELWQSDIRMNARGVLVDADLVAGAIELDEVDKANKMEEAKRLTGLDNPKSGPQFQKYLNKMLGERAPDNVRKETLTELASADDTLDEIKRAIDLKIQLSKASTSKFSAMETCAGPDNRVRGISQYYGAHTGRYAGRLVQLQNMTKNKSSDIEYLKDMRNLVKSSNLEGLRLLYGEHTGDILSQLVRTSFIAPAGSRLVVADFHSIEAAVIGWLAGEEWVNEVFRGDGKIYEATASQMFNVPIDTIKKGGKNYHLRQRGKVATLALGYQGGTGSLISMGALKNGIPEEDLPGIVEMWRNANKHIVKFWYDLENACIRIMRGDTKEEKVRCLTLRREIDLNTSQDFLTIELPVGRKLYYARPSLQNNKFDRPALHYWTVDARKWKEIETYGGKLTENCIAEDTLVLTDSGWKPIQDIKLTDKVWDGVKWVRHEGLISKGVQDVISVDGVEMTPDHKVLTEEGWKNASSCEGYNRREAVLPNSRIIRRLRRKEKSMEHTVRLWEAVHNACGRMAKGEAKVLRLHEKAPNIASPRYTRNVEYANLQRLAFNEGALRVSDCSSVAQLRGQRYQSLSGMVGELRSFLSRHGSNLQERSYARPNRRERGLRAKQLQMDIDERTKQEQEKQSLDRYAVGQDHNSRGLRAFWDKCYHVMLQAKQRHRRGLTVHQTGHKKQVYDIKNAGDLHRFTVLGENGALIVHNCVQAIARDCLCDCLLKLEQLGIDILFHVHDEIICEIPYDKDFGVKELEALMGEPFDWAPGLKLTAAGFEAPFYIKD